MEGSMRYDERIALALREIYRRFGYQQYKMRKFEEYDLYARNKDFLLSDSVITFTDLNGALMALKPDVTLSIVNSGRDGAGVQKVYYHESVYRVSSGAQSYRELMQTGVECIGDVDDYCIAETLLIAAECLKTISSECVLVLSQMEIVSELADRLNVDADCRAQILRCVGEKNLHGTQALCREHGADEAASAQLLKLLQIAGTPEAVLPRLRELGCAPEAVNQLAALTATLEQLGCSEMLRVDFSLVNDMHYYNGVVFKGYVSGVPASVLSGGQYDSLMRKMHRRDRAIGFAVYLDQLERIAGSAEETDVDILLLYDKDTSAAEVLRAVKRLSADGARVSAQRCVPERLRYGRLEQLPGDEVSTVEDA